ncbi:MAG TPA: DUF6580 family putative transport protein [Puia sp.]|nr:DUF6580 family putative transport protein [Puia sp.]
MKINKTIVWSLVALVLVAALYRIIPGRPYGFAPQWAMAIFAGAVIKDKRWAFLVPVLSMFLSDLLYQVLYNSGVSSIPGFYEGQWQNYLLFALMAIFGMLMKKINIQRVFLASLAAPTLYFILSNLVLWAGWSGTRGLGRPKTWDGLMLCYNDALPFYRTSILATMVFSAVLFGGYYLLSRHANKTATA